MGFYSNRKRFFILTLIAVAAAAATAGCGIWSKPSPAYSAAARTPPVETYMSGEVYPASEVPGYVAKIKAVRVFANRERLDTGIDLQAGKLYSIMARGRIFLDPEDEGRGPAERRFVKSIGDEVRTPVFQADAGDTFVAIAAGRLYLGIGEKPLDDNLGHFDVILVSWKTEDYAQIAEFLQKLSERHPDHPGITQAFLKADKVRDLSAARRATAIEIEQTRERILALQQPAPKKGGLKPEERLAQQRELERRLADLTARMAQLDQVSQQLEQEKTRAARLSQELERERKERERMSRIAAEGKTAPLLLVTSPEDGAQSESGSIRLAGAVEDDRGLQSFEVFLNGRPLETSGERGIRTVGDSAPRRVNFDRRIQLDEGANELLILVTDTDGLKAEKRLAVNFFPKRRNVWAAVIGINDYPRLPPLKYAVNDAKAFYRHLVEDNRVPAENVTLLLNEQASLLNLRSTLGTRIKNAAAENDMVIIFFAGHGATERDVTSPDGDGLEKYLLPFDAQPSDLYSTALPMVEIARIFNRIRSERMVFIADACYSGGSGGRTVPAAGVRANLNDGFLERIAGGRGKVILTASAANEVSVERDELGHGVFTFYLLEGMRGAADTDRDGQITVDEAYRYVYDRVPQATGQEQHPVKRGTIEGRLVLSVPR
jgi:primosomal protein N''